MKQKITIFSILILVVMLFVSACMFAQSVESQVVGQSVSISYQWLAGIGTTLAAIIGGFIKLFSMKWNAGIKDVQLVLAEQFSEFRITMTKEFGGFQKEVTSQLHEVEQTTKERFEITEDKIDNITNTLNMHTYAISNLTKDIDVIKNCENAMHKRDKHFEEIWTGIEPDLKPTNNEKLMSVARIFREKVQQFSKEVSSWDYAAAKSMDEKKHLIDGLRLRGNFILDEARVLAKAIAGDIVYKIEDANTKSRLDFENELMMIVADTVNGKGEAIHMASIQFLRRTLNTLVLIYRNEK